MGSTTSANLKGAKILEETNVGEIVIHVYVESVFGMGKSFSKVGNSRGSDAHVQKLSHTNDRVEGGVEEKRIGVAGLTKGEDLVSFRGWLTFHFDSVLASPRESNNHLVNRDIGGGKKKAGKILLQLGGERTQFGVPVNVVIIEG
jgi:hypothetical protein